MKFTQANVTKLAPPKGKERADFVLWDPELPRFGIRFRAGKPVSYLVQYTLNGREGRLGLGKVTQVRLDDARKSARQHFASVANKIDPAVERAKAVATNDPVINDELVNRFKTHLENKNRSPDYVDRVVRYLEGTERHAYLRTLRKIPLGHLDRRMVARELDRIAEENGPLAMTGARAALSKFLNWMIQQGYPITNAADGTARYDSEQRDRVLSPDELKIIWQAAGDGMHGQIVRLLMLTAMRRSQVGSLRKAEVKLAASPIATEDRLIALPGRGPKTSRKGGSKHSDHFLLPLSSQAIKLLEGVSEREGSDYVFGEGGEGGFSGWSKAKRALDERIGDEISEPWGFHDFRRSFQTLSHDILKTPDSHTDYVLNHKPQSKQGVRGRYNFALYLPEKRDAMQAWGGYIETLTKPKLKVVA